MFTRLVKMQFEKEHIPTFLTNFETVKEKIRNFPGCTFLELYRDRNDGTIFFTHSRWHDGIALEKYRNSTLFKEVWGKTKPLFSTKAEAWSVDTLHSLK